MGSIELSGLATGIDTDAMIKALLDAEKGRINQLKARRSVADARGKSYDEIQSKLSTLRDKIKSLRSTADLRAFTVQSSNTEALTVEATSSASEGSHEVVINRLATAERSVHAGAAEKTTKVGQGTFSYSYNGETRTLTTTAEMTLEGLRDLINNDAANPGVSASLLEYNSGDGKAFHLVLNGNDSGSKYAITINDDKTTLDGSAGKLDFRNASFLETQGALNSQVRVDGYPSGAWIERSTNTIDDILPGVTLHLHKAQTAQVTLTRDTAALKKSLNDWVSAYNAGIEYMKSQTAYSEETKTGGLLQGDHTVNYVRQQIREVFIKAAAGFQTGVDGYTLAGEIGLSVDREGKMKLDSTKLDEAISDNYLAVLNLVGANGSGASSDPHLQFFDSTDDTKAGSYEVKATFDEAGKLLSAMIRNTGEPNTAWRAATISENVIVGAAGKPEEDMQIIASWDGVSTTQTATVRLREGLANNLYNSLEKLLDKEDGSVPIARNRCTTTIENIDKNMEREQARLDRLETSLKMRFARLEAALTQMKSQQSAVASL